MKVSKHKVIITALSMALIIVTTLLINTYSNLNTQRETLAHINAKNWESIHRLTENIDHLEINSVEDIENYSNYPYHNGVIYSVSDLLMPSFNEAEFGFLTGSYDALLQALVKELIEDSKKEEAFNLFINMNNSLKEICTFVVIDNADNELDFIDENSELYKELQSKINDFCEKYQAEYESLLA